MVRTALDLTLYALLALATLGLWRVVIGPTPEDRMIGLSLVASQTLAMLVVVAVRDHKPAYMDVALVYAVLGFAGILALARHVRGGSR